MSEWQPIESAPEGKYVLIFCPGMYECTSCVADLFKGQWYSPTQGEGYPLHENPTDWMPIPEPPNGD